MHRAISLIKLFKHSLLYFITYYSKSPNQVKSIANIMPFANTKGVEKHCFISQINLIIQTSINAPFGSDESGAISPHFQIHVNIE